MDIEPGFFITSVLKTGVFLIDIKFHFIYRAPVQVILVIQLLIFLMLAWFLMNTKCISE